MVFFHLSILRLLKNRFKHKPPSPVFTSPVFKVSVFKAFLTLVSHFYLSRSYLQKIVLRFEFVLSVEKQNDKKTF